MRLLLHVCFINSCACFNGPFQGLLYLLNDGSNNIMEINGKIFKKISWIFNKEDGVGSVQ